MKRRVFLSAIMGAVVTPAVVKAESLKALVTPVSSVVHLSNTTRRGTHRKLNNNSVSGARVNFANPLYYPNKFNPTNHIAH